jgi:Trk K+ transport system NAD-binding subunit
MQIRIIGCGAMGSAIAQTLAEAGKEITLYDKHRRAYHWRCHFACHKTSRF